MNMALQKFAHGATHYCKFKHTALCENALHYDNKTTINKQILCRFQKIFFQRSKKWNTPFYLQMFCAFSGRSLSRNTPVFSRFTSRVRTRKLHRLPFFSHSYASQLIKYCGKRSFLGVAKSWKATLIRVPWFGRHVENLGDVIIYPVLVARTVLPSTIFHCHKIKDGGYNNITNTNKVSPTQNTPVLQAI